MNQRDMTRTKALFYIKETPVGINYFSSLKSTPYLATYIEAGGFLNIIEEKAAPSANRRDKRTQNC
jgi:hypothetical protein